MKNTFTLLIFFVCCIVIKPLYAAERIFFEDCESTNFSEHFLERHYGSNYEIYWNEFINEVSQSSENPYGGSYSMRYNPARTRNPHAQMALGPSNHGNTSDFQIRSTNRYWYFRWYQRWENSSYTGLNKLWYLGGHGDYYYLCKSGPSSFIYLIRSEINGTVLSHGYRSHHADLDDEQWHKMEIYIDFGTTGNSNGSTWVKIDDRTLYDATGLAFTSHSNPIPGVMWPSNYSGNISGSQRIWLDNLEIYELSGPNDIPGNIPNPPQDPQLEAGNIHIDSNWTRFNFKRSYTEPVVVAGPLSLRGGQPAVVRIRNVTSTGFEIRAQEWPYLDGRHVRENVSYMVMERGNYTLADGTRLEASSFTTDGTDGVQSILFEQSYHQSPVVAASVVSFNTTDAIAGRASGIGTEGFEYRLQAQEDGPSATAAEQISYIAWEPSAGTLNGLSYEIDKTADVVTHELHSIGFNYSFSASPALIADMQSFDGPDTAGLRLKNKNSASVEVMIDEETSQDREVYHCSEVVGYMALTPGATDTASR